MIPLCDSSILVRYQKVTTRKCLVHIGQGNVVLGVKQMVGVCQTVMLSSSRMVSTLDIVKELHLPTISKGEALALWDKCMLSRDKIYTLGSYLMRYLGSWILYPLRN